MLCSDKYSKGVTKKGKPSTSPGGLLCQKCKMRYCPSCCMALAEAVPEKYLDEIEEDRALVRAVDYAKSRTTKIKTFICNHCFVWNKLTLGM